MESSRAEEEKEKETWDYLPLDTQRIILNNLYLDDDRHLISQYRLINKQFRDEIKNVQTPHKRPYSFYEDHENDMLAAIRSENALIDTLEWLKHKNWIPHHLACTNEIAKKGFLRAIQWLHHHDLRGFSQNVMDDAAQTGHLHVVRWLHENRSEGCTVYAMDMAACYGHLHVVEWLHENRQEGCTKRAMDCAARCGHLDVVIWLHRNRHEGCTTYAMNYASANGHLHVIEWLHLNRDEGCTTYAMDNAIRSGSLNIIKWLHQNRHEGCTTDAMDEAARYGHLNVIKWLHENRDEGCTRLAMTNAAIEGHLHIVKWLHDHRDEGCEYDTLETLAASGSYLDVMQFLYESRRNEIGLVGNALRTTKMKIKSEIHEFDEEEIDKHLETLLWLNEKCVEEKIVFQKKNKIKNKMNGQSIIEHDVFDNVISNLNKLHHVMENDTNKYVRSLGMSLKTNLDLLDCVGQSFRFNL